MTAVSPPRRTPGAIYLANLCHVIGNFIIFLEASQSRQPGTGHREGRMTERKVEEDGCWVIRLGYGGGPAASREDGYPLFESRNAPDEKCTRLKFTARKKGASDLEAYQIVIVGNRRLIYHGNTSYPCLLSTDSPLGVFNYYHSHSHFCASRTMATAVERLHLLVP